MAKISDYKAFCNHYVYLKMDNSKRFRIDLNCPLSVYLDVCAAYCAIEDADNEETKKSYIIRAAQSILGCDNSNMRGISIDNMLACISAFFDELTKLLDDDYLQIPDVIVPVKPHKTNAKNTNSIDKADSIQKLNIELQKYRKKNLIDDIAVVMSDTSNNYSDVLAMPILVFRALVKKIYIDRAKNDADWYLQYLLQEKKNINNKLNNGDITDAVKPQKGTSLKGLINYMK